ncbi:uncharacterized protein [Lepeophtheirus salmonis]|uniref:uncharacterized protein isoform X2 n=1 Tax=Lepeophtheirus salmonis TaxID=72036 RepID=UPI001AEB4A4F|nr:uncharacterized protein LOC121121192 isoform X2 [Lepeophtheirus salmonis]
MGNIHRRRALPSDKKKMAVRKVSNRKLSSDMHRKLSAISNCSDVSDISQKLGMAPSEFKKTVKNILDFDIGGESWSDEDDTSFAYEEEDDAPYKEITFNVPAPPRRKISQVLTRPEPKKSTHSQISVDSLDTAEDFSPVDIDIDALKNVLDLYNHHQRKISLSKVINQPTPRERIEKETTKRM